MQRCIAQVHGMVWDTLEFVSNIVQVEMNSCTDNPVVLHERYKNDSSSDSDSDSVIVTVIAVVLTNATHTLDTTLTVTLVQQ